MPNLPSRPAGGSPRGVATSPRAALQACAGLAAAMGVGRFMYTPLLPLMEQQTAATSSDTAFVATANYLGYFLGAAALIAWPARARSRRLYRGSLAVLVATEAVMIAAPNVPLWSAARLVAGVASACVFVYCAGALVARPHPGLGYAGVGVGIAASGLAVTLLQTVLGWEPLWLVAAGLGAAFAAAAWTLPPGDGEAGGPDAGVADSGGADAGGADSEGDGDPGAARVADGAGGTGGSAEPQDAGPTGSSAVLTSGGKGGRRAGRDAVLLTGAYFLEGLGYIILGTFLVAAVSEGGPAWTGPAAWVLVGVAAAPSTALWSVARKRFSTESLLVAALLLQAVSAMLPALVGGAAAAAVASVLFGGTFMGVVILCMTAGVELGMPRAAAVLTTGYAVGQILGPLVVTPLLGGGYAATFITAAAVLVVAAGMAAGIRRGRAG